MSETAEDANPEGKSEVTAGKFTAPDGPEKDVFDKDDFLLEDFISTPYMFVLKDANGFEVSLPPNRLLNARIECPRFYVLLDHLLAVLWSFYSRKGLDLLESNQIHWALKILEGTKNKHGQYTDDVQMAIDHLTDAYVDVCSNSDITKLENRSYVQETVIPPHRSRKKEGSIVEKKVTAGGYESFKADMKQQAILKNASLHLADMICDADPDIIDELLVSKDKILQDDYLCIKRESTPAAHFREIELKEDQKNVIVLRNNKFQEVVKILEEIIKLDETIQELPKNRSDALKFMLADVLKKPEDDEAKSDDAAMNVAQPKTVD